MFFALAAASPLPLPLPEWETPLPAPLTSTISGATGVGIGESAHLSGDLERVRNWVAYRLVVEEGFRTVAVELSWEEGLRVDASLQGCLHGSFEQPKGVTDPFWSAYWPLTEQLCRFNRAHPDDPVHLIGVDVQDAWNHRDRLGARPGLDSCHGTQADSKAGLAAWARANGYPPPTLAQQRTCLAALKEDLQHTDPDRRLAARSLEATMRSAVAMLAENDLVRSYDLRETAMLEALERGRARTEAKRFVLMAHDEHVAKTKKTYLPMGARLAKSGGYVALAVTAAQAESRLPGAPVIEPEVGVGGALPSAPVVWVQPDPRGRHDGLLYLKHARAPAQ